jgi:hypothetical protein
MSISEIIKQNNNNTFLAILLTKIYNIIDNFTKNNNNFENIK